MLFDAWQSVQQLAQTPKSDSDAAQSPCTPEEILPEQMPDCGEACDVGLDEKASSADEGGSSKKLDAILAEMPDEIMPEQMPDRSAEQKRKWDEAMTEAWQKLTKATQESLENILVVGTDGHVEPMKEDTQRRSTTSTSRVRISNVQFQISSLPLLSIIARRVD